MSLREAISDALIIGLSAALLWHFSNIWRYGDHFIRSPNITIRILETAGLSAILVFGVIKYISDLKRGSGKRNNKPRL